MSEILEKKKILAKLGFEPREELLISYQWRNIVVRLRYLALSYYM